MDTKFLRVACALCVSMLAASPAAGAATVNYRGYVFNDLFNPAPIVNGFAIAGIFAQNFDPDDFSCVYGDDPFCNMFTTHYSEAVADGNFLPIGPGTLTDTAGYFSGSGMTSAPPGAPIYLFVFDTADPDASANFGLATGSDSSFSVPADMGSTTVQTNLVNSFVFGYSANGGIAVNILPFPEPATCTLALLAPIGFGMVGHRKQRRM